MAVVQVVGADGAWAANKGSWFTEDADLGSQAITVVSIIGAHGSGKSTLLNQALGTAFTIGKRGSPQPGTKGVAAAKAAGSPLVLVFDVEGADARDRSPSSPAFASRCAGFAAALSDVILVNLYVHEVGALQAPAFQLLEAIFSETAKAADEGAAMTSVLFLVRDVHPDLDTAALRLTLVKDATEMWNAVSPGSANSVDSFFNFDVQFVPHFKYDSENFSQKCTELRSMLVDSSNPSFQAQTKFSKGIPANGFAEFASNLWQSLYASVATSKDTARDIEGSTNPSAVLASDAAFSSALILAEAEIASLTNQVSGGDLIDDLGFKGDQIASEVLRAYDGATEGFQDDVAVHRRRAELDKLLDMQIHSAFIRNLQLAREMCFADFKAAIASSETSNAQAESFLARTRFREIAERSLRPGSDWSYVAEQSDLENTLNEIVAQRQLVESTRIATARQHAQVIEYLQYTHAQTLQHQSFGGGGRGGSWNVGAAYRPPDSNINISLGYQQGRTNIQISMVPDEQASLLGPNGFTAGVGPANLGLSFNINM